MLSQSQSNTIFLLNYSYTVVDTGVGNVIQLGRFITSPWLNRLDSKGIHRDVTENLLLNELQALSFKFNKRSLSPKGSSHIWYLKTFILQLLSAVIGWRNALRNERKRVSLQISSFNTISLLPLIDSLSWSIKHIRQHSYLLDVPRRCYRALLQKSRNCMWFNL